MLADLISLLDKPIVLFIVLALGGAIGITVERLVEGQRSAAKRAYWNGIRAGKGSVTKSESQIALSRTEGRPASDSALQLKAVMAASFAPRPLLNQPERRLLSVIDEVLAMESPGWRAMGQVSLGEILWTKNKEAFWAINAKRVDLLIIDNNCRPLHALEFQGTGHFVGPETAARDAIKKEALRRAGIGFVEVVSGDTPSQVRETVRKLIKRSALHDAS